jgi:azurin
VKKLALVALVAAIVLALEAPAFANKCPSLIKQANDQMAQMDQNSDKVKKAKSLVEEADKLHKAGNHPDSVKKAEEALSILK